MCQIANLTASLSGKFISDSQIREDELKLRKPHLWTESYRIPWAELIMKRKKESLEFPSWNRYD